MSQPTYTLSWILPFVRRSLKGVGNLEYRTFMQHLWMKLEEVHLVMRLDLHQQQMQRRTFDFDNAPHGLMAAANEAFFYLVRNGYVVPLHSGGVLNHPSFQSYDITARGKEWADGNEPLPEDIAGYMKFLRDRVLNMDSVIEQYVSEALIAFERQAYFAAAVMLGAASEKALYLLAEAMVNALKSLKAKQTLEQHLKGRSFNPFFTFIRDALERNRKLPNMPYDGAITHLMSLFEAVRTQRNDAVHPNTGQVSADSVRLLTASFPYALSKSEELRTWLVANPQSLD